MKPAAALVLALGWALAGPDGTPLFTAEQAPPFATESDCRDTADWLNTSVGWPYYRCVEVPER